MERLPVKSRQELTAVVCGRYRKASRTEKTRILDEYCAATGYNRQYAAMLLSGYGTRRVVAGGGTATKIVATKNGKRAGGRPTIYGDAVQTAVMSLWRRFGFLCGKRLAPLIRSSITEIRTDPFMDASDEVCEALQRVSPATIDRLLQEEKARLRYPKQHGHTRAVGGLWDQIPIRTFGDWANVEPGHMQMDTVGHDAGFGTADCAFSLCLTDVCLGWTERRGLQNRAARWVVGALNEIREVVPFPICHVHPDNGSEFINRNMARYCRENQIELSRSRPERKNDNCYVEQKNFDTIRKIVGYGRISSPEALTVLNNLYRVHGLLQNYFLPSQKLTSKTRVGSRVHKRYDAPQSPADRLLAHPKISPQIKASVRATKRRLSALSLADEAARLQADLAKLVDRFISRCLSREDVS